MPKTLKKVKKLREMRDGNTENFNYLIQVDGGVNNETISDIKAAGVDVVVAGSFIFKSDNYKKSIKILHDA
ncbi:MAG: hypothetical protein ACTSWY_12645 [Promethearchaeota archaeon]